MPLQIYRPHQIEHGQMVTNARKLIELSKRLLDESSASALGIKHYVQFALDGQTRRSRKRAALRVIAGSKNKKVSYSVGMEWLATAAAPFDRDLQLAVIDVDGVHKLVFPCRRVLRGWVKATTREPVIVRPTHWREWNDAISTSSRPVSCSDS